MQIPIAWLLEGEPFIEYRTRRDLLGQSEQDDRVQAARQAMLAEARVQNLIIELAGWPGTVVASHKSASQPFHKLTFLADLGLNKNDPGMDVIIKRILDHQSLEGPFQLPMNIGTNYGGTGQEIWGWALCDSPLIVYALARFGLQNKPVFKTAAAYLLSLVRENGWPCAVSKEMKFRGPGRKEDPCPFANLAMLKALSAIEEFHDSQVCRNGAETLLNLWSESLVRHPYIFYMGTDFRKLKVPFIWYDLMHVLEVLSHFEWLKNDPRLLEMTAILKSKMNEDGQFTLESVWMAWKDWEFGQKKQASRWLTLAAWRIIQRVDNGHAKLEEE